MLVMLSTYVQRTDFRRKFVCGIIEKDRILSCISYLTQYLVLVPKMELRSSVAQYVPGRDSKVVVFINKSSANCVKVLCRVAPQESSSVTI